MDSEYEGLETLLPDDTDSNRSRSQTRPEPIGQFLNSPRDLHVSAPSSSLSWDETNSHETNNQLEEAIRRAQALSIAHTDIKKIWKDLQESHQVAARRNNELLEFPYWVMREVPHRNIERIIDGIYDSDHYLTLYPIIMHAYEKKQEDAWVFYLFFGNIHQALAKAMVKVAQYLYLHKPTKIDSFDGLYRKVKQIRDRRIKKGTPRPGKNILGFLPQDFHSYLNYIQQRFPLDGDDNDAAIFNIDGESDRGRSPQARLRSSRRVTARPSQQTVTQTATRASRVELSDAITIESDSDDGNLIDDGNNRKRPAGDDFSNPDTNEDMGTFSVNVRIKWDRSSKCPGRGSSEGLIPP
jgi:hypothetical protein